jgi:hypothetical protein
MRQAAPQISMFELLPSALKNSNYFYLTSCKITFKGDFYTYFTIQLRVFSYRGRLTGSFLSFLHKVHFVIEYGLAFSPAAWFLLGTGDIMNFISPPFTTS